MQRDFLLPDVGEGLEDATVVQWHVDVGDTVHLNEPLVTIETAKAAVELPSPFDGQVVLLNAAEGDELRVGELLARIDTSEEVASGARAPSAASSPEAGAPPEQLPAGPSTDESPGSPAPERPAERDGSPSRQSVLVGYGADEEHRPASARREWRRPEALTGSYRGGEGGARGPLAPRPAATDEPEAPPTVPAAPLWQGPLAKPPVRWLARSLGVDIRRLRPTGPRGEVTRGDVEAAARLASTAGRAGPADAVPEDELARWPTSEPGGDVASEAARVPVTRFDEREEEGIEEIPVRGVRARIAARMSASRSTIPEATCGLWVDCGRLLALRSEIHDDRQRRADASSSGTASLGVEPLTPFAVLAWIVPFALRTAPLLNSSFDAEAKVIRVHRAVHLGIATSTEQGLLVPVLRRAHARGVLEFAGELGRLTCAARDGRLDPAELTGSTFTVTNYGALGLDDGNPVINAPEAAILGVGMIAPRPAVHDGELAVRQTAKLICAFDHRVCDGADAARFLRRLKTLVERPELLLARS